MGTVLKKLHELRPGRQAFLSKNGGCELGQAKAHIVPANRRDSPDPQPSNSLSGTCWPCFHDVVRKETSRWGFCQVGTHKTEAQRKMSSTVGV